MDVDYDFEVFRRPLGTLSLVLVFVFVLTGAYELVTTGEFGTATLVVSLVTYATIVATALENWWHVGTQ